LSLFCRCFCSCGFGSAFLTHFFAYHLFSRIRGERS
jgi:hypothetical protein